MHNERDLIMGVLAMAIVLVLPALWIVCHYTFLCWKQSQTTALVREMIGRGFTPQEIIQLCQALGCRTPRHMKLANENPAIDAPPAKPIKQPTYAAN
jgi:hypothetical protein